MFLFEILDSGTEYKVVANNGALFKTQAEIGGRTIVFSAQTMWDRNYKDAWEAGFHELSGPGGMTFRATGSGNAMEVFSMVKSSLAQFINIRKPEMIHFSASFDSGVNGQTRGNVYSRLINKFGVPGYKLERDSSGGRDDFMLIREQEPEQQQQVPQQQAQQVPQQQAQQAQQG